MVNKLACLDLKIVFKNKISHVGGTPELEPHGMPISKLQYVTVTVSVSHQDTFHHLPGSDDVPFRDGLTIHTQQNPSTGDTQS